jgi:hypothetical protein
VRALAIVVTLGLISPVLADGELDEAKRHFEQAVALYGDGNFDAALAEFEAAGKLHPNPSLLYNIGLCQKGLHRYGEAIATLEKFLTDALAATAAQKSEANQLIADMKAVSGTVTLTITPEGAAVTIDKRDAGKAPLAPLLLPAGTHTVEVAAEGFVAARQELSVVAGAPLALTIALAAIPKTGKIKLTVPHKSAHIVVDGKEQGPSPVELELSAGGHQLEVSAPGWVTLRRDLVAAAGAQESVTIELQRPAHTPVYKKWWVWTIGAVLLGGVVAAIAVPLSAKTQGPLDGTLQPGAGRAN